MLGYRPDMQKRLKNDVGKEMARLRREQAEKRRAAEKKAI